MLDNLNEKLQTAYEYGNWTDVIKEADAKLDEELAKGKEQAKWGKITGTLADQEDLKDALDEANENAKWGEISGTLNDQTDLKDALDGLEDAIEDKSIVSGTDDGTNWTGLTIDGVTKGIGGGMKFYRHVLYIDYYVINTPKRIGITIVDNSSEVINTTEKLFAHLENVGLATAGYYGVRMYTFDHTLIDVGIGDNMLSLGVLFNTNDKTKMSMFSFNLTTKTENSRYDTAITRVQDSVKELFAS